MEIIVLLALALLIIVALLAIFFFFGSQGPSRGANRVAVPRPRDDAPRRVQIARNRGARMRIHAQPQDEEPHDDNTPEQTDTADLPDEKIGAKKRAKLEAKAEKKAQREADEQLRKEKKKRDQHAEEERKLQEEKQQAEEKRIEEERRQAKEEKEKREHEEYLKMKEAFTVEQAGYEESEDGGHNMLHEFIDYIKTNKVVVIEDLAAVFKLKTQAAIDRIQDLQKDDILTGVIDDRGKFICVSPQEMEAVAKFIKQRGRISISELAEHSNHLINLTPPTPVR